ARRGSRRPHSGRGLLAPSLAGRLPVRAGAGAESVRPRPAGEAVKVRDPMSPLGYPWRWLADAVGDAFVLRYPWVEAVRRAVATHEQACVILPEAAGPLADWGEWLSELIGRENAVP